MALLRHSLFFTESVVKETLAQFSCGRSPSSNGLKVLKQPNLIHFLKTPAINLLIHLNAARKQARLLTNGALSSTVRRRSLAGRRGMTRFRMCPRLNDLVAMILPYVKVSQ
jgi:hypothetical protein